MTSAQWLRQPVTMSLRRPPGSCVCLRTIHARLYSKKTSNTVEIPSIILTICFSPGFFVYPVQIFLYMFSRRAAPLPEEWADSAIFFECASTLVKASKLHCIQSKKIRYLHSYVWCATGQRRSLAFDTYGLRTPITSVQMFLFVKSMTPFAISVVRK